MIFSALSKFFKTLIDGFANLCAFLLVRLRLWIAAVYCLLYIIVCAVAGIALSGKTVQIFIAGLILCLIGGIVWTVLSYYRRKNYSPRRIENARQSDIQRVAWRDESYEGYYSGRNENNFLLNGENKTRQEPQEEEVVTKSRELMDKQSAASRQKSYNFSAYNQKERLYDDFSDLKQKYLAEKESEENSGFSRTSDRVGQNSILPRTRDNVQANSAQTQSKTNQLTMQSQEKLNNLFDTQPRQAPMIFAMRRDPDVLIYEYSDRLEFCRKTKKGLVLEKIEYKI